MCPICEGYHLEFRFCYDFFHLFLLYWEYLLSTEYVFWVEDEIYTKVKATYNSKW